MYIAIEGFRDAAEIHYFHWSLGQFVVFLSVRPQTHLYDRVSTGATKSERKESEMSIQISHPSDTFSWSVIERKNLTVFVHHSFYASIHRIQVYQQGTDEQWTDSQTIPESRYDDTTISFDDTGRTEHVRHCSVIQRWLTLVFAVLDSFFKDVFDSRGSSTS